MTLHQNIFNNKLSPLFNIMLFISNIPDKWYRGHGHTCRTTFLISIFNFMQIMMLLGESEKHNASSHLHICIFLCLAMFVEFDARIINVVRITKLPVEAEMKGKKIRWSFECFNYGIITIEAVWWWFYLNTVILPSTWMVVGWFHFG